MVVLLVLSGGLGAVEAEADDGVPLVCA